MYVCQYLVLLLCNNFCVLYILIFFTYFHCTTLFYVFVMFVGLLFYQNFFSQPSIYLDLWLYGMRVTSVVCNVPVLSQNDSTYHHSVFTT